VPQSDLDNWCSKPYGRCPAIDRRQANLVRVVRLYHRNWSFTPEGAKAVRSAVQAGRRLLGATQANWRNSLKQNDLAHFIGDNRRRLPILMSFRRMPDLGLNVPPERPLAVAYSL
jgi:hypothetical protein